MAKKRGEYLANDPDYVPDPEIEEFMELEISAPEIRSCWLIACATIPLLRRATPGAIWMPIGKM